MRPQVALWDRIKGEPLKISMKAMDLAVEHGTLQLDMSKLKPWWGQNAVYDEYYTYVWAHKSVKDVLATVYLDAMVYDAVRNHPEPLVRSQGACENGRYIARSRKRQRQK